MELKTILWRAFLDTGDIDVYLLYKTTDDTVKTREEDYVWQTSEPKAS